MKTMEMMESIERKRAWSRLVGLLAVILHICLGGGGGDCLMRLNAEREEAINALYIAFFPVADR